MRVPVFVTPALKYTSANLLNALIPILLLPLLTAYLSKDDYGLLSLFQVMTMLVMPFVGFSSSAAIERAYYDKGIRFGSYVSNGYYAILVTGFGLLIIFAAFGDVLETLTEFPSTLCWTVALYCMFNNVGDIILAYWRLRNNTLEFGLFRVGRTVVEILLTMALVIFFAKGWLGRLDAMAASAGVFALLGSAILARKGLLNLRIRTDYLKHMLRFGLPLVPHVLGGVILVYSDRLFIAKMVGLEETGSYTVGYQVAMAISLLQSSFNLAWVPWFYGKLTEGNQETNLKIVKFTYLYNSLMLVSAIALTSISPIIFAYVIDVKYHDSIKYVFWIAIAFAFDGMYKMVVNYIFYLRKTYIISIVTFATAALNIVLNYFLIKRYGALGAAYATAACLFLEYLVVWFIASRLYKMPWVFFISDKHLSGSK